MALKKNPEHLFAMSSALRNIFNGSLGAIILSSVEKIAPQNLV